MKKNTKLIFFLALVNFLTQAALGQEVNNTVPLTLLQAEAGTPLALGPDIGLWKLLPIPAISNCEGALYAWRIKLNTNNCLFLEEKIELSDTPKIWGIPSTGSKLTESGRICTIERFVLPQNGWIGDISVNSKGDPSGKTIIKVSIDKKLVKTFEFYVVDPK